MDQLKKISATLRKHHFWLLAVVAIVAVFVGQFLAAGSLRTTTAQNRKVVDTTFDNLQKIQQKPAIPNEKVNEGISARTEEQRQRVAAIWQELYGIQKKSVLHWPQELGENFLTRISGLKFGDPLDVQMREYYRDYVRERFEQLPNIVKASAQSVARAVSRGERRSGTGPVASQPQSNEDEGASAEKYLVDWDDYGEIADKLIWEETPSNLKVWITQEDLWVYETLLTIIAKANEGATGPHDAVVKAIQRLQVGQEAAQGTSTGSRIFRPVQTGTGQEPSSAAPASPGEEESEATPGGSAAGQLGPESSEGEQLLAGRYLDAQGVPVTGATADPGAEFKRLPVRMELTMDAREIPRVLVECANAPLPVEVQQVRINVAEGNTRERAAEVPDPAVVPVIIQGIIYIFNPPDREMLGLPAEPAPVAATDATESTS